MHERSIFAAALEITDPSQRSAYLDKVCANDTELRQRVESLLSAQQKLGNFLTTSPGEQQKTVITDPLEERPGSVIGPYKLVDLIGEGGMGLVFVAEQEKPVRRKVALKVIKPGMDSAQILARFDTERQALTLMDHVNIARVFDAGATEKGRPYYVMELVEGVPMTHFCDENKLTIRQRLELFTTVCAAIQHAHQKGIIHRDIKPSNVLVAMYDGKPLAKVIDFGLAKAIQTPLTEHTQLTGFGVIVGTLEYMSPEQANFDTSGIDTRADVYSLGVILYELLTGTRPRDRGKRSDEGYYEMLQWIRETEPPRPSVRVAGLERRLDRLAGVRQIEPAKMAKLLRGELDWIVMKALEKDRERRYETASGLANDVQRYLNDEPVEACPPAKMYQLGKFARKNRTMLAMAGLVVGLLVIGVASLGAAWNRESKQRQQAEMALADEQEGYQLAEAALVAALRSGIQLKPAETRKLRDILARAKGFHHKTGMNQDSRPRDARANFFFGHLHLILGNKAESTASYRTAMHLYEQLTKDYPGVLKYRVDLARCNFDLPPLLTGIGQRAEAEAAYRRAIALHEQLVADFPSEPEYLRDLVDDYNMLGVHLHVRGEDAKAESAYRQAITQVQQLLKIADTPPNRVALAQCYHNLGNAIRDQGHAKLALDSYNQAMSTLATLRIRQYESARQVFRNVAWDRANALGQLGLHAEASREWQRALSVMPMSFREALELFLVTSKEEERVRALINPPANQLYAAAQLNARATAAATTAGEPTLRARYTKRAMELLEQAKAAGWFRDPARITHLKDDKVFKSMPSEVFKAFIAGLGNGKK